MNPFASKRAITDITDLIFVVCELCVLILVGSSLLEKITNSVAFPPIVCYVLDLGF